jgi:2-polyprenyl-3-methyl-5-hydroxy-6-metoxy-1,4-benzoquinol methylase
MLNREAIYSLYRNCGLATKLYLRIKFRICPFQALETYFPRAGKVIDLGCGNGVFSNLLKLGSPSREIIGFDLDPKKIRAARKAHKDVGGLEFQVSNITDMDYPSGDVFSIIDVLYLIPSDKQEEMLRKCYQALSKGGTLILKDMDTRPRWKYLWNIFQETIAVKIIEFTRGGKFYFRGRSDYLRLLEAIGFKVKSISLDRGYSYPHVLFIAVKE